MSLSTLQFITDMGQNLAIFGLLLAHVFLAKAVKR